MSVIAVNRRHIYPLTVELCVFDCAECGIVYGVPLAFVQQRKADGGRFYCPNGHSLGYNETDADRERARADAAESRAAQAEAAAKRARLARSAAERSARAYRGHLTRMKNRIANGVCPVPGCKRSGFTNVMRHIASKHPAWHHDHAELNPVGEHGGRHP